MRWMMLLLLCLGLPAQADLDYRLAPRQIAEGTWLLEGSTDNFGKANGVISSIPRSLSPTAVWL